jgi:hypothetical protein
MEGQPYIYEKSIGIFTQPIPTIQGGSLKTKLRNKELNELLEWFGLSDKEIHITLEDDIKDVMDKYYDEHQEHEKKKKEFVSLFKECYSDIVKIMEFDPHKRVPVNCYTCIKGMDLSKQYGKPKKK